MVDSVPMLAKPNSTLLVFLPGIADLQDLSTMFSSLSSKQPVHANTGEPTDYRIFILHSTIMRADQEAAFQQPKDGVCNVVLASNIAESSVTLPNVAAIIDFGLQREMVFDSKQRLSRLATAWCSRASAKQRTGRAGRTAPGVAVHLVSRRFFHERMEEFDTPEILKMSLSRLVLRAKRHSTPSA